jgi:hypothetical protein
MMKLEAGDQGIRGSGEEREGLFFLGGEEGGVGDLLADAGDGGGEGALDGGVGLEAVDEVGDGVVVRGLEIGGGDGFAAGMTFGLEADGGFVVVGAEGALGAFKDEAAFGLGLVCPWIGEGAPAGFEFGEAAIVSGDGDAVFVDFEAGGLVDHGGDFEGSFAVVIPGAEGGAVSEVIEERAPPLGLFVEPGGVFFFGSGFVFDFIGAVVEGATVAIVVVDFGELADAAFADELVGFDVGRDPAEGPVDGELFAGGVHGGDHAIGVGEGGGERFFDEDMDLVGGDFHGPFGVAGGGGAEDDEVGLGFGEAGIGVGEDLGFGEVEVLDGAAHAFRMFVADGDDFGVRMVVGHAEEVTHVEVIEVDAGDTHEGGDISRGDAETRRFLRLRFGG